MPKTAPKAATKPAASKAQGKVEAKVETKAETKAPAKVPGKGDHVFLVDGSSYIFRAYHALPPLNRKSDGLQVNAVLGFCNMLWKLLRDMKPEEKPTHLAVIFDKSEHTFRNEFYPAYKAHRPDAPDDLVPQFKYIREAVRAFDIPCLEQAGFEADDLIATYAREACEVGATTTIVSSDKDLMQLVGDTVVMYDTMKDRRIGREEVIERFGVGPEKIIEVQSLIGDSTDNVPGVPGIGVKTAAQLISEYGDLETLLKRAGEIKQEKRRQSLIDFAEQARISKRLVTLDPNVPLETPLAELAVHEPDYRRLIAFLKAMEFSGLSRRVADASDIDPGKIDPDPRHRAGRPPPPARPASPAAHPPPLGEGRSSPPPRRRSPPRAPKPRATPGSIARNTRRCAASIASKAGSSALPRPGSRPSRSRPRASIRCRASSWVSRSRCSPTRPATCRSRTGRPEATARCSVPIPCPIRFRSTPRSTHCGRCSKTPPSSRSATT